MSKEIPSFPGEQDLPPELREEARDLVAPIMDEVRQIIATVPDMKPGQRADLDNKAYRRASFNPKTNEGLDRFFEQLREARAANKNVTIVRSEGMIELWVDILPQ